MKIRNGYVSNSSSSSFVLAFKNKNADSFFGNLASWEGYDTFIKDYTSAKNCKGKMKEFIENDVRNLCHHLAYFHLWQDRSEWERAYEDTFVGAVLLLHHDVVDDIRDIVDANRAKETSKKLTDAGWRAIEKFGKKKSKEVLVRVQKEFASFTVLEYADDETAGSYMEHYFMPFLLNNPISQKDWENQHLMRISHH